MQLNISNLSKTYPNGVQALKGVNLSIQNGLFGLLGPNGAGKSTLMRTIATLQDADEGTVFLDELNVLEQKHEVRKLLGYLPQEFGVYANVSAEKLLDHLAVLKGATDKKFRKQVVEGLLKQTNLYDDRMKKLGGFSGGMKQRFGVAQTLLGDPKIIIVDEPTAGLDPNERKRFLNFLSEISEQVIVILSTHIVDDVKEVCSQMAIIHEGEMKYKGKPAEAVQSVQGKIWRKFIDKAELENYNEIFNVVSTKMVEGTVDLHVWSESQPDGFELIEADLEDVYFSVINGFIN